MTIDELNVAQAHRIPVVLTGDKYSSLTGRYHIENIIQHYNYELKCYERSAKIAEDEFVIGIYLSGSDSLSETKDRLYKQLEELASEYTGLSYEISIEECPRCIYTIDSHYLSIAKGFENILNAKVNELRQDKLSVFLGKCLQEGMTRKKINALVKSVLDKLEKKPAPKLKDKDLIAEFEKLWKEYPRKQGKKTALSAYISSRKKGTTYEEVEKGIKAYKEIIRKGKIKPEFIKQGGLYFNGERWKDEYTREYMSDKLWGKPSFDIDKIVEDTELNDNYDI